MELHRGEREEEEIHGRGESIGTKKEEGKPCYGLTHHHYHWLSLFNIICLSSELLKFVEKKGWEQPTIQALSVLREMINVLLINMGQESMKNAKWDNKYRKVYQIN